MKLFRKKQTEDSSETEEMSFFDHFGELRKRIMWALFFVIIGCIISAFNIDVLMNEILLNPATNAKLNLQNLKPFGQPFLYFKIVLIAGIIISIPFILFQIWKFVSPGLYSNERKWVRVITFFTSLCFFGGVAFSYFVMVPSMLAFAASFGTDKIVNNIDVNEFLSFITMILLAAGILFEMPMVAFVLSKFGIVKAKTMSKYRRHSIVAILILAAVLTPTPDPISQSIFAAPLLVLYEISIIIAKLSEKKETISNA